MRRLDATQSAWRNCRLTSCTLRGMEVHLTPEQQALIRYAVQSGRLHGEDEALQEADCSMGSTGTGTCRDADAIAQAEASIALGKGRIISDTNALADEIKRRGRARLADERNAPR